MAGGSNQPGASDAKARAVLHFTIPSDFMAGRDVQLQIMQSVESFGYSEQDQFAIKLALEEALINAIKHGNRNDPHKKVIVDAVVSKDCVILELEDQGPGFNRKGVPDPTLEENLEKPSGRGILLIETYMSDVIWSKGGRHLKMTRHRDGQAHS